MAILARMTANRKLALRGAFLGWVAIGLTIGVASAADQPLADAARHADWGVVTARWWSRGPT